MLFSSVQTSGNLFARHNWTTPLAADSGISFQFSDEHPLDFVVGSPTDVRVTFDMESSPFATLETLASFHGYLVARDAAGWSLEPINTDDGVKRALQWIKEFEMRGGDLSNSESVNSLAEIGMSNETIRKLIDDFRRLNPDDKIANFLPEGFTTRITDSEGE